MKLKRVNLIPPDSGTKFVMAVTGSGPNTIWIFWNHVIGVNEIDIGSILDSVKGRLIPTAMRRGALNLVPTNMRHLESASVRLDRFKTNHLTWNNTEAPMTAKFGAFSHK